MQQVAASMVQDWGACRAMIFISFCSTVVQCWLHMPQLPPSSWTSAVHSRNTHGQLDLGHVWQLLWYCEAKLPCVLGQLIMTCQESHATAPQSCQMAAKVWLHSAFLEITGSPFTSRDFLNACWRPLKTLRDWLLSNLQADAGSQRIITRKKQIPQALVLDADLAFLLICSRQWVRGLSA